MPDIITDTHALIWYLQDDTRLSATASKHLTQCEHDGGHIYVPSICLVEILYLSEKGRIPADMLDVLFSNLNKQDTIHIH